MGFEKVVSKAAFVLIGNFFYLFCQWLVFSFWAKSENYLYLGQLSLAFAISAPVIQFTNMNLKSVISSDIQGSNSFYDYLMFRLSMSFVAIVIISIISIISANNINEIIFLVLFGFGKSVESIGDIFYGAMYKNGLMKKTSVSQIIKGLIIILTLILIVKYTNSLLLGGVFYVVFILFAIIYDISVIKKEMPRDYEILIKNLQQIDAFFKYKWIIMIKISLPLGVIGGLLSYGSTIPRYFISFYLGNEELSIYTSIFYLFNIGTQAAMAISEATIPSISQVLHDNNIVLYRKITIRLIITILLISILANLLVYIFGKNILQILYNPTFTKHNDVLQISMVLLPIACSHQYFYNVILIIRKINITLKVYVIQIISLIILCFFGVPKYGMIGAAGAHLVSYILQITFIIILLNTFLPFEKIKIHKG